MTNILRAKKVNAIGRVCDFVTPKGDDDQNPTHWLIGWGHPRDNQSASVNAETGEVTDFRFQSGMVVKKVDPASHMSMIDRRITYLFEKSVHKLQASEVVS